VLIVGQFIDELDPPLYDIKVRRDGPTEVTFHHEPTAVELEELAKQHPGYVITGVTFRRDPTEEEVEKLKKEHPGYVVISRPAATP